jgi:hypothetical protein
MIQPWLVAAVVVGVASARLPTSVEADRGGVVDVMDHGAKGDGVTDDSAAINRAIATVPNGGMVWFPPGTYLHGGTINSGDKTVRLAGTGWVHRANDPFGNPSWTSSALFGGSVIRFTGPGDGIVVAAARGTHKVIMEDLALIGSGRGASVGVNIGTSTIATVQSYLKNVGIFNFAIGLKMRRTYEATVIHTAIRGCETGLAVDDSSNQNAFYNLEVQHCKTGIAIVGGNSNNFYSGLLQNLTADGLVVTDANVMEFRGFHFENHGTLDGYDIRIETTGSTSNLLFSNNRITQPSSREGGVLVNGGVSAVFLGNRVLNGRFRVTASATNTVLLFNNFGVAAYTNDSSSTVRFDTALNLRRTTLAYRPTVAIDASVGNLFVLTVTDGRPFTVTNPTNGTIGQMITLTIRNASGGDLGGMRWDTSYRLAPWTSPASNRSRSVSLTFDGRYWVEVSRTPADVPN